ncbi:MAG: hypothetical protein CMC18_08165 [Flavobacteriaceae bacterium]|nr:hypothetical protein [Flavobacteriaceae bacterium]
MNTLELSNRLKSLGLNLPPAPKPLGVYKPFAISGNYLYVSGHGPVLNSSELIKGKAGLDLDKDQAKEAARQVGLTLLSTLVTYLNPDIRITKVVKVLGMINSTPDFNEHTYAINGFSELLAEVFGDENGIGARSAVGMMLPQNITAEVEAIFEIEH